MNSDDLIAFETEIADLFNAGEIPYPVHLNDGNEKQLIDIFKTIERKDWVLGSWRMHYQALLHGVPRELLKKAIMDGHSMALNFPGHRVFGSAIVGGTLPIAVGTAMGIMRRGTGERVHVFCGDMTAETGIFHECSKYAYNHALPIHFIIENNGYSVCTDTAKVWKLHRWSGESRLPCVTRYRYKSKYPHAGAGVRVQF